MQRREDNFRINFWGSGIFSCIASFFNRISLAYSSSVIKRNSSLVGSADIPSADVASAKALALSFVVHSFLARRSVARSALAVSATKFTSAFVIEASAKTTTLDAVFRFLPTLLEKFSNLFSERSSFFPTLTKLFSSSLKPKLTRYSRIVSCAKPSPAFHLRLIVLRRASLVFSFHRYDLNSIRPVAKRICSVPQFMLFPHPINNR